MEALKLRRFIRKLLTAGGWPKTRSNVRALKAWAACEGTAATWNPLGTTQAAEGSTDFNDIGVQNYPNINTGVSATLATLNNGRYPAIVRNLAKGTLTEGIRRNFEIRDELQLWGTGAYCPASKLGGFQDNSEWA